MTGCLHAFTRAAYAGGMVQVFRERFHGFRSETPCDGPYELLLNYGDVNSMYSWAMLGKVPVELSTVASGCSPYQLWIDAGYLGFIDCTVEIPSDCYLPPLPFRHKGKLIFPVGRFSGIWTSEELSVLPLVGGKVVSIRQAVWFRGKDIFTPYVKHWFQFRDKSVPGYSLALDMVAKLFLNSLYGKFGQSPEREKLWFFPSDDEFAEHELVPIPGAGPEHGAYKETTISDPPYVIPHIAAWITAKSRIRLWNLMFGFLSRGFRIYYCDTDSVITDAPIQSSTELGALKLECQVKRARFVAPKMYFLEKADGDHYVKAKGFTAGFGKKSLTELEFDALVSHGVKVKVQRMRKLREGVKSKERFPAMKTLQKGLRSGVLDDKRIHLPDGNTRPVNVQLDLGLV